MMGAVMSWFIYRRAIALKDMGERLKWGWLIRVGLGLKGVAYRGKAK